MPFTIKQSVVDKKYGVAGIPLTVDKRVPAIEDGSPIGLLLSLTYTS